MAVPRVSILLPTLDAEPYLDRLLAAIEGQAFEGGVEVRAIDSSSGDRTREILAARGAVVRRIERADFRHGPTRNLLAQEAKGELCVFLSQDALPADEHWLTRLVAPLEDAGVAGSTSRVLPFPEDDPLTARTVLSAPEASAEGCILRAEAWREGAAAPRFNDVSSCVRASVLRELPFPDVPFGEDLAWALAALERGWDLAFAADSIVLHAHRYGPSQAFERYRVDAAFQRRILGRIVRPGLLSVARGIAWELREDVRHLSRERGPWRALLRAPVLRSAQVFGQFFGSRGWRLRDGSEATRKFR